MADMNTTDVRTISAAEAAEDKALWKQVARGEVEIRDSDGDLVLSAFNDKTRVAGRYLNSTGDEYWFMYTNEAPFTVRRVQPAGDDVREATPDEAVLTWTLAELAKARDENATLRAQLVEAKAAFEAITMSDLATGTACEWCGGIRWTAEGDTPDIDHAPNCPVRIAQEALAALRADSELDTEERSL